MTAPEELSATVLKGGRYTLLRVLGEGSQGATYEGRDNGAPVPRPSAARLAEDFDAYVKRAREGTPMREDASRGLVAIKCFRIDRAKQWKDVELAEREARTLSSLDHPRLPRYIEHFEEGGALYLVMEKIEGESLAAIRAKGRTLAPGEIEKMIAEVGEALRYLHGRAPPVVHRDIKPGNVIRRPDGAFALVDFGAVRDRLKPAGGSTVVGTFGFMAPEQFQGRASPKSDLYGLGATALAMLTGTEPEDLPHQGLGVDVDSAVPPGTPRELVRALKAMLVPNPDERASSVEEVLALLAAKPQPASAAPAEGRHEARRRRREEERDEHRRAAREAKRAAKIERHRRRERRRARRPPLFPRLVAKLGLAIATLAVWIAVGFVTPLVLTILSVLFGPALRRAAKACFSAAQRSTASMQRASRWLSGERVEDEIATSETPHVRVDGAAEPAVRVAEDATPVEEPLEDEAPEERAGKRAR